MGSNPDNALMYYFCNTFSDYVLYKETTFCVFLTRLKTAMRVYCADGYYGPRCHLYCEDGPTYTCEAFTGKKLCVPGIGGIECDEVRNIMPLLH